MPVYTGRGLKRSLPIAVSENAPPLCIFRATDDHVIPWQRSMELFVAWKETGSLAEILYFKPVDMVLWKKGGGGTDHFMDRIQEWIKVNGWLIWDNRMRLEPS